MIALKVFWFIFVLDCAVLCLKPNYEYNYKYEGQIKTGLPALKNQVAGVGIKSNVTIQVLKNETLLVKLSGVKVGNFSGLSEFCHGMNISYKNLPDHQHLLEEPFKLHMNSDEGIVMSVPKEDTIWITNIRKSIAQYFFIFPLKSNFTPGHHHENQPSWNLGASAPPFFYHPVEESLLGKCQSEYTFEPFQTEESNSCITEGNGSCSGSGNESDTEVIRWKAHRTINFDNCSEEVVLQSSTAGSYPDVGRSFETSTQSRISFSDLEFSQRQGALVLERVRTTGEILSDLYGVNDNKYRTKTNQTLELVSSDMISEKMHLTSAQKDLYTMNYNVFSPFPKPSTGNGKPWIEYDQHGSVDTPFSLEALSIGKNMTKEEAEDAGFYFSSLLDEITEDLLTAPKLPDEKISLSTIQENTLEKLNLMSEILRNIPIIIKQGIFSREPSGEKISKMNFRDYLAADIALASGNPLYVKEVLNMMEFGYMSDEWLVTMFMTLANQISNPDILDQFFEVVTDLSIFQRPFWTSVAAVNFANAMRRVCLESNSFPRDIFGNFGCDDVKFTKYMAFIFERIFHYKDHWVQMIYLETALRIGPPYATYFLQNVLAKDELSDPVLKLTLVRGLRRHGSSIPEKQKLQMTETMRGIIDNQKEDIRVRQNAVMTIISWHPNNTFWHRLALKTHTEKSPVMAAFLYFTVKDMSEVTNPAIREQAAMAKFALPFCKKFGYNYRYPLQYLEDSILPLSQFQVGEGFTFIPGALKELAAYMTSNLHGKIEDIFDINFDESHSGFFPQNHKTGINSDDSKKYYGSVLLSLWKTIEEILPINYYTIKNSIGVGGNRLLRTLHQDGADVHMTKFFIASSRDVFIPSEIGLPVFIKTSMPVLIFNEGHLSIFRPDMYDITFLKLWKSLHVDMPYKSDSRFMYKLISKVDIIVPWDETVATCGTDNVKVINLPTFGHFLQNINQDGFRNISINLTPMYNNTLPLFYAHNIPYTSLSRFFPKRPFDDVMNFTIISLADDQRPLYVNTLNVSGSHGVVGELSWKADESFRFSRGFILDCVKSPLKALKVLMAPTDKLMQTSLNFDVEKSFSKSFTFAFSFAKSDYCEDSDPAQKVPKSVDLSSGYTIYTNLKKEHIKSTTYFTSFEAQAFGPFGPEINSYKFEVMITLDERHNVLVKKNGLAIVQYFQTIYPTGFTEKSVSCIYAHFDSIRVESIADLRKLLVNKNYSRKLKLILVSDEDECSFDSKPTIKFEGSISVSPERRQMLLKDVQQSCPSDPLDPTMNFQTDAVYDQGILASRKHTKKVSHFDVKLFGVIKDLLQIYFQPDVENNYLDVANPEREVHTAFKRSIGSKTWDVRLTLPRQNTSITNVELPRFADQIVYVGGFEPPPDPCNSVEKAPTRNNTKLSGNKLYGEHYWIPEENVGISTFDANKFTNFDGRQLQFTSIGCFTLICKPNKIHGEPSWKIYVRVKDAKTKTVEARLRIDNDKIEINSDEVKFNGRKVIFIENYIRILDNSRRIFCTIFKNKNNFKVSTVTGLQMTVTKSQVKIEAPKKYRGKFLGLGGQFDGSTTYIGPKNCIYNGNDISSVQLFGYSWTISEPDDASCDHAIQEDEDLMVIAYQRDCTKKVYEDSEKENVD